MRAERRRAAAVVLCTALALSARARAGAGGGPEDLVGDPVPSPLAAHAAAPDDDPAPRAVLARQLADETASIERALAAVGDKLAGAERARTLRLAAAIRAARAAPGDDAAAVARRRAAARVLLERDRGERALLADEAVRLRGARDRVAEEVARLPAIALPDQLARPAPGKIVRHFGMLAHERSGATLSRRGIDLDVDEHGPVVAPAAGTVRYAGPIRGLDHGVIVDCGDYLTVIAKLADLALPVGAPIAAGDRLGRAARHRVYLEVRVKLGPGGLPIDPEPLLERPEPRAPASHRGARFRSARHGLD